jgi:hypothetical protein
MNIKKLLVLGAVGLIPSVTLAAYSNYRAMPTSSITNRIGTYLEAFGGYNRYAFRTAFSSGVSWNNGTGNWAFGGAIGYQFHQYFSAELGGIYTFNSREMDTQHRPWYGFLSGKVAIPLFNKFSIFTKLGFGYQRLIDDGDAINKERWGAMFGAGLSYYFVSQFYIFGQWLRFTGNVANGVPQMTAPNIFLLGLGGKFLL